MTSFWLWLFVSSLNGPPPPDWGSASNSSASNAATGPSGSWQLTCGSSAAATFAELSGPTDVAAQLVERRSGEAVNRRFPLSANVKDVGLTFRRGSDPGWIGAWRAQSTRPGFRRECTLSRVSSDGQTLVTYRVHNAYPDQLEESGATVEKLHLNEEGYEIVH